VVFALAAILVGGFPTVERVWASSQDPDPAITITGTERLVWDQSAESAGELAGFRFVFYVDNEPIEAPTVVCDSGRSAFAFSCSSPLPPLTSGEHVVQVATLGADSVESPRSSPISLVMMNTEAGVQPSSTQNRSFITSDGIRLNATLLATGIEDATDLAVISGGRIVIAERAGRIRLFQPGKRSLDLAATLTDVDSSTPGSGLLAIAASGELDQTATVYVVHTTSSGARLARFASDAHGLTARATLLDGLPVSREHPHASLRIGPDRKLYLALDDAGKAERVGDLGSMNGKVLRLNVDGTTPSDASGGLLYADGVNRPTAMAWSVDGSLFWLTGFGADGAQELRRNAVGLRATTKEITRSSLPSWMDTSAMLVYRRDERSSLNGDLLIAGTLAQSILRARITASGSIESSEWLFTDELDGIRAMTVDATGTIYLCTEGSLIRITVQD
jgi:hypothetical protein